MRQLLLALGLWLGISGMLPPTPAAAEDWFQKGLSALKSGAYAEAIDAFTLAIEAVPHDFEALNNRGFARIFIGDYEGAVADCTQALIINPNSAKSYNNRGFARIYQEDFDGAITDFDQAIAINPRYVDAYSNRGLAYLRKGRFHRAIEDCTAALRINPRSAKALYNRGFTLDKMGNPGRALLDYTQALTITPDYTDIYNNIAWILATCPDGRFRDGRRAVAFAKRAVERSPSLGFLDTLAAAHAEAGQFEEAVAIQNRILAMAVAADPDQAAPAYAERLSRYETGEPYREHYTVRPGAQPEEVHRRLATLDRLVGIVPTADDDTETVAHPGGNQPPVAGRLFYETREDEPVEILLTGRDPDGDRLRFETTSSPIHGTLSGTPPRLVYRPESQFSGTDRFRYRVLDNALASEPGSVVIRIQPVNDPPAPAGQTVDVIEDQPARFQLSATDPEFTAVTFTIDDPPANGRLEGEPPEMTYRPDPDFSGTDHFTYRASDGQTHSLPVKVILKVRAVNDPPLAAAGNVRIRQNTETPVELSATDPDGDTLDYTLDTLPENGSLAGTPPLLRYTPHEGYLGEDRIGFRVSDGLLESEVAFVTLTVSEQPHPSTHPDQTTLTTPVNTPLPLDLTPRGTDRADIVMESVPLNGTLSGTMPLLVYTPRPGFTGTDAFSYRLTDGIQPSDLIRVRIEVTAAATTDPSPVVRPADPEPVPVHGPVAEAGTPAPETVAILKDADLEDQPRRELPKSTLAPSVRESTEPRPTPEVPAVSAPVLPGQPATEPETPRTPTGAGEARFSQPVYAVQIHSVRDRMAAEKGVQELEEEGLSAFYRVAEVAGRGKWHRIYIGPFESLKAAKAEAMRMAEGPFPNAFAKRLEVERTAAPATEPGRERQATPYAYQVRSFTELAAARQLADRLRVRGRKAFIGQATVREGEMWHRVYIGAYPSPAVAESARAALDDSELSGVFLVYLPYCLEMEAVNSPTAVTEIETRLIETGFVPYRLPPREAAGSERVVVGGFYKKKDAETLRRQLETAGFTPTLADR